MKALTLLLIAISAAPAMGCATILTGTTQDVTIDSDPPGAQVLVDGAPSGTTPLTVTLQRGRLHRMELSLEGYEDAAGLTRSSFNGWVLLGGVLTYFVDYATGAWQWIRPAEYRFTLQPRKDP